MTMLARYKYLFVLFIAALCAVGAVFLTRHYFEVKERELREKIRQETLKIDVVVAKHNLRIGDRIDLETMEIRSIPQEYIPDGAIKPEHFQAVADRSLSSPMSAGKPLLRHFVEGMKRVEKFSDLLAVGERAITLQVDAISSVENMLQAGDFIDLAVKSSAGAEFSLLLERIQVLSTGNYTISDPKVPGLYKKAQYSTITLGVDGRYVKDVFEANSSGDLVFLLRNEKDTLSPTYELADAGKTNVSVISGGSSNEGVLKEIREEVTVFQSESIVKAVRNEKGRLVKLAEDDTLVSSDQENEAKSEVASNE